MDQEKLTAVKEKLAKVDQRLADVFSELITTTTDPKQAVDFAKLVLKEPDTASTYLQVREDLPGVAPTYLRILLTDPRLARTYLNLKKIRERQDLKARRNKYLRDFFIGSDGEPREIQPRYYQVQMILHLQAMHNFVVGDDTGLGKTFETIASLSYLFEQDPDTKVIILAKKSAVPQWASEFEKFTQGVKVVVSKGSAKKRREAWEEWHKTTGKPTVLVSGYRSAVSDFKTQIQDAGGYVLVCDEVQVCKNPRTQVHQVVQYMGTQASRIWGLSATIIKNNLMEGYGIFRVVVPDLFKLSANAFMMRFCIVKMQRIKNNRQVPVIVGYRKDQIQEFKDLIDPFFLGRPKHEVADELPVLVTKQIECDLTTFQWTKYQEALGGLLETGLGEEKEITPLTAVTYCQEIVNHPALIDFEGEKSGKLNMLGELLTDGGDLHGEKVIVFTRFERMVTEAMDFLGKKGVKCVRVTGKETEDERDLAKRQFQDPNSDVQVVWITMAGGDSINLQAAKALVFFDTPWSAGDYIQILGRMIRIGSVHDRVYAIHLVCRGTVDQRVIQVMHKKMNLVEAIIGKRVLGEEDDDTGTEIIKVDGKAINEVYDALLDDARNMEKK